MTMSCLSGRTTKIPTSSCLTLLPLSSGMSCGSVSSEHSTRRSKTTVSRANTYVPSYVLSRVGKDIGGRMCVYAVGLRHHTLTASSVFLPTNFDVASLQTRHDLCDDALELADGLRGALVVDQRRVSQRLCPNICCHVTLGDRQDFPLTQEIEHGAGVHLRLQCCHLVAQVVLVGF